MVGPVLRTRLTRLLRRTRARPDRRAQTESPLLRTEADALVDNEVKRLRALTYGDVLARRNETQHDDVTTPSGVPLLLEVDVFWDDERRRTLRVGVDIWQVPASVGDGRWRGTTPVARRDFIRAPDGSFVDDDD